MASINSAKIIALVEKATNQNEGGAAGIAFQAVDKTGKVLASTASGVKSIATSEPVSLDTLFWIASCSKLTTSIALMQLVERGEADLDDADLVARVLPELAAAKVLEDGVEREQEGRITLRMLLTHTAGLSYTFLWEEYWKSIGREEGRDEFQGKADAFIQPLKYQPGKGREYAIGIDWCGIFIERTTGLKLGKYFEKNIFEPLGLTSTAFVPTEEMRGRLASMHTRDETGKLQLRKHLNRIGESADGAEDYFHSGGGGLFSTVTDYCKILAAIMNDGISAATGNRILNKATIDEMFTNQVPDYEEKWATAGYPICRFDLVSAALREEQPAAGHQGWGLSFLLMGENLQLATAPGICNCFWVMDREKGVGGILMSQMLPLGDMAVMGTWMQILGVLYA